MSDLRQRTRVCGCKRAHSPLSVRPQQIGPQHYRHVPRRHLVIILKLVQLSKKFDQIPDGHQTMSSVPEGFYSKILYINV